MGADGLGRDTLSYHRTTTCEDTGDGGVVVQTAWMWEEKIRLAQLEKGEKKCLERDLTDMFARYLDSHCRLSLEWICSPDVDVNSSREPDQVYEDSATSLSIAVEVTRLYDETQKDWGGFCGRVIQAFDPGAGGHFSIGIPYRLPVPVGRVVPARLAHELTGIRPDQRVDLVSLLGPGASAVRLPGPQYRPPVVQPFFLDVPRFVFGPKYQDNLRETNDKLRRWHKEGCETFLLYDARLIGALLANTVTEEGNRVGHMFQSDWSGNIVSEDYSCIDHVIVFELCENGVGAESLRTHAQCHLPVPGIPTGWTIKPANWHYD
jgi:hypothetical protein